MWTTIDLGAYDFFLVVSGTSRHACACAQSFAFCFSFWQVAVLRFGSFLLAASYLYRIASCHKQRKTSLLAAHAVNRAAHSDLHDLADPKSHMRAG